jgi:YHS domain-containing protein
MQRRELLWRGAATGIVFITGARVVSAPFAAAAPAETRLAIRGYDPVAYFTDGKPVEGNPQFQTVWHRATWHFASAAHRDLFISNPNHYAPQYDGYCAMGVSDGEGHKDTVDPQAWTIVDSKLYLNNSMHWREVWRQHEGENIARADKNWPTVKDGPEPLTN